MDLSEYVEPTIAFIRANQVWAFDRFALAFGESVAFPLVVLPSTVFLVAIGGLLGAAASISAGVARRGHRGSLGYAVPTGSDFSSRTRSTTLAHSPATRR